MNYKLPKENIPYYKRNYNLKSNKTNKNKHSSSSLSSEITNQLTLNISSNSYKEFSYKNKKSLLLVVNDVKSIVIIFLILSILLFLCKSNHYHNNIF